MSGKIQNIFHINDLGTFVVGEVEDGVFKIGEEVCFTNMCKCKTTLYSYFVHNDTLKKGDKFSLKVDCKDLNPGDIIRLP